MRRRSAKAYDLAIIGGGTGGLVSAQIAAGLGARVVLIERARTGGDISGRSKMGKDELKRAVARAKG